MKTTNFIYLYICTEFNKQLLRHKLYTMGKLGLTEILIILAVVLLLFGGKKIPELMKGLGSGIKEFKNAAKDENPPVSKAQNVSTDPIAPSDPSNPTTTVVEEHDRK